MRAYDSIFELRYSRNGPWDREQRFLFVRKSLRGRRAGLRSLLAWLGWHWSLGPRPGARS